MSKARIVSWTRKVASVRNTLNNIDEGIDNLKGQLHVASAVENTKQTAAIQTELDRLERDRTKIADSLLSLVNTGEVEGVDTRLTDVSVRMETVDQLFELWRRRLAQYEHCATLDLFVEDDTVEEGITRTKMTELVEDAKKQYETALQNADNLVPNKAVLIL